MIYIYIDNQITFANTVLFKSPVKRPQTEIEFKNGSFSVVLSSKASPVWRDVDLLTHIHSQRSPTASPSRA